MYSEGCFERKKGYVAKFWIVDPILNVLFQLQITLQLLAAITALPSRDKFN